MNVLINDKGELLEILQEPKEPQESESIILLDGYYEVFNVERYEQAKWDFEVGKWVGVGEQRPTPLPQPKTELELLQITQSQVVLALVVGGLM